MAATKFWALSFSVMLLILNARYDRFVGTLSLLILPATCWLRQNAAACSMSLVYVGPQPRRISLLSTGYHRYSLAATKWTKHGLTAIAIPGHDPPTDISVSAGLVKSWALFVWRCSNSFSENSRCQKLPYSSNGSHTVFKARPLMSSVTPYETWWPSGFSNPEKLQYL